MRLRVCKSAWKVTVTLFGVYLIGHLIHLLSASCRLEKGQYCGIFGNIHINTEDMSTRNILDYRQTTIGHRNITTKDNYTEPSVCQPNRCLLHGKRVERVYLAVGLLTTMHGDTDTAVVKKTIDSLISNGDYIEKRFFTIVVYANHWNRTLNRQYAREIRRRYADLCEMGVILFIQSPYENILESKKSDYGNEQQESLPLPLQKLNLDRSFLYRYSSHVASYFIEIALGETSILHYGLRIKSFLDSIKKPFYKVQFSGSGNTGMLFPHEHLAAVAEYLQKFCDTWPTYKILLKYGDRIFYTKRAVFQSSEKIPRKSKEELRHDVIAKLLKLKGQNPAATVLTDMTTFEGNIPEHAYDRDDFTYFWTSVVDSGSSFKVVFSEPQNISRIVVTTGNYINNDRLQHGVLLIGKVFSKITADCDLIVEQWKFVDGMVDTQTEMDSTSYNDNIKCLSIEVKSRQHDWLMIRDIFVL